MTAAPKVTMEHVYAAGLCATGARKFFTGLGLKKEFGRFLSEGFAVEEVEAMLPNAIAQKVLEAYRGRQ